MKKVILSISMLSLFGNAAPVLPYNIVENELSYQVDFRKMECVYRDRDSREAFVSAIKENVWWVDDKPVPLDGFKERAIFVNTYSDGDELTLVFTKTLAACNKVSNTLFNYINKK